MKAESAKDATFTPKTGGGKGANIASPAHTDVTGANKVGSKIALAGTRYPRSAGSKR